MHRSKLSISLMIISGILFLSALLFLAISGYNWLLLHFIPPVAALMMTGVVMFFCTVAGISGYYLIKRTAKPTIPADEMTDQISILVSSAGEGVSRSLKESPKSTLLIARIAGLIAGSQMK